MRSLGVINGLISWNPIPTPVPSKYTPAGKEEQLGSAEEVGGRTPCRKAVDIWPSLKRLSPISIDFLCL